MDNLINELGDLLDDVQYDESLVHLSDKDMVEIMNTHFK